MSITDQPTSINFIGGAGALRTASLFYECWKEMKPERQVVVPPVYSLYRDYPNVVNARKLFIQENDPTGYKFATKYLRDWGHWKRLMTFKWFSDAVEAWREELDAKNQEAALAKIRTISASGSPAAFAAAKYIANNEYKRLGSDKKRGRPSKVEVEARLREEASKAGGEAADLERMKPRLVVSN